MDTFTPPPVDSLVDEETFVPPPVDSLVEDEQFVPPPVESLVEEDDEQFTPPSLREVGEDTTAFGMLWNSARPQMPLITVADAVTGDAVTGSVQTIRKAWDQLKQIGNVGEIIGEGVLAEEAQKEVEYQRAMLEGIPKSNLPDWVKNAWMKAAAWEMDRAVKAADKFAKMIPEDITDIGELQQEIDQIPESKDVQAYQQAEGFWNKMGVVVTNPVELPLNIAIRGGVMSTASIAAGTVGTVLGGPGGGVAGVGVGSFATEFLSSVLGSLQESGVDLKDAQAVAEKFNDPVFMEQAKASAALKGVPVAVFDMASAGLAGKFLIAAKATGRSLAVAAGKEAGVQGFLGGAGEVTGSLAAGKEIDLTAVFEEVIGEMIPGSREVAQAYIQDRRQSQQKAMVLDGAMQVHEENQAAAAEQARIAQANVELKASAVAAVNANQTAAVQRVSAIQRLEDLEKEQERLAAVGAEGAAVQKTADANAQAAIANVQTIEAADAELGAAVAELVVTDSLQGSAMDSIPASFAGDAGSSPAPAPISSLEAEPLEAATEQEAAPASTASALEAAPVAPVTPEGVTVEPLGKRYLVMEGVGEPVEQFQVRMPGETGRGRTLTAEQMQAEGIPVPGVEAAAVKIAPVEGFVDWGSVGIPDRNAVTLTAPVPELGGRGIAGNTVLVSELEAVGYTMPDVIPDAPKRTMTFGTKPIESAAAKQTAAKPPALPPAVAVPKPTESETPRIASVPNPMTEAEAEQGMGVDVPAINEVVRAWTSANPGAESLEIEVVDDPTWAHNGYIVRGAYRNGVLVLNAAGIKDSKVAREVLNHEFAHDLMSTNDGQSELVSFSKRDLPKNQIAALKKKYKRGDGETQLQYELRIVEEWIAKHAETEQTAFAKFVQSVREFLANAGIVDLTNEEVATVMLRTLRESRTVQATTPTQITAAAATAPIEEAEDIGDSPDAPIMEAPGEPVDSEIGAESADVTDEELAASISTGSFTHRGARRALSRIRAIDKEVAAIKKQMIAKKRRGKWYEKQVRLQAEIDRLLVERLNIQADFGDNQAAEALARYEEQTAAAENSPELVVWQWMLSHGLPTVENLRAEKNPLAEDVASLELPEEVFDEDVTTELDRLGGTLAEELARTGDQEAVNIVREGTDPRADWVINKVSGAHRYVVSRGIGTKNFSLKARVDVPVLEVTPRFSLGDLFVNTPAFKEWFGDSKVVDANGNPKVVFHGTGRADRVGNQFRKNRATSGPMQYFTDDPVIGSKYAEGKNDTSFERPSDYAGWFTFKGKGQRSAVPIDRAWYQLTPEQRALVAQRIYTVGWENYQEADGPIVANSESIQSRQGIDWEMKQAGGNALRALVETWLNSGALFGREAEFMNVLKAAGVPMETVTFVDPNEKFSAVYPVFLAISNPLDTEAIPDDVRSALEQAGKRKRARQAAGGDPDMWDKNTVSGPDWLARLSEDKRNGTTHAWTSVPDWVTETLKVFGYDGIKDTGGKMGGAGHQVWVPFEPTQIKSATGNRGTFDRTNPDIRFSLADEPPAFYSQLSRTIDAKVQGRTASPDQLKAVITAGAKAEEIKWSGVMQEIDRLAAANDGKVPMDQLRSYLADSGAVKFVEVRSGELTPDEQSRYDEFVMMGALAGVQKLTQQEIGEWMKLRNKVSGGNVRYESYQTPGGTNYKEVVLSMPPKDEQKYKRQPITVSSYKVEDGTTYWQAEIGTSGQTLIGRKSEEEARRDGEAMEDERVSEIRQRPVGYTSNHFPSVSNYVAHMRTNERNDASGAPGLFMEEIQSDRHQAGRKFGYTGDNAPSDDDIASVNAQYRAALAKYNESADRLQATRKEVVDSEQRINGEVMKKWGLKEYGEVYDLEPARLTQWNREVEAAFQNDPVYQDADRRVDAERAETSRLREEAAALSEKLNDLNNGKKAGIADAPFRTSWPLQMFKRGLRDAVAAGKKWIGWTTGDAQGERYDLSKQVSRIGYDPKNAQLTAFDLNGRRVLSEDVPLNKIEDYIGKEPAKSIADQIAAKPDTIAVVEGDGLKVGGEGMKGFYDSILPKEVGKYVKQWGAVVEKGFVQISKEEERSQSEPIWQVRITPQMEAGVRSGQPLFSLGEPIEPALTKEERAAKVARIKVLTAKIKPYGEKVKLTRVEANEYKKLGAEISALRFDVSRPLDPAKIKSAEDRQSTLTPETIVVAQADLMRDRDVYSAIDSAAMGVAHNADTAIDDILTGKNPKVSARKFYDSFAASRDALRKQYGDTITLFRAVGKQKDKPTTNWATTEEFAKEFGSEIVSREVPIEQIIAINVGPSGNYHELIVGKEPAQAAPAAPIQEAAPVVAESATTEEAPVQGPAIQPLEDWVAGTFGSEPQAAAIGGISPSRGNVPVSIRDAARPVSRAAGPSPTEGKQGPIEQADDRVPPANRISVPPVAPPPAPPLALEMQDEDEGANPPRLTVFSQKVGPVYVPQSMEEAKQLAQERIFNGEQEVNDAATKLWWDNFYQWSDPERGRDIAMEIYQRGNHSDLIWGQVQNQMRIYAYKLAALGDRSMVEHFNRSVNGLPVVSMTGDTTSAARTLAGRSDWNSAAWTTMKVIEGQKAVEAEKQVGSKDLVDELRLEINKAVPNLEALLGRLMEVFKGVRKVLSDEDSLWQKYKDEISKAVVAAIAVKKPGEQALLAKFSGAIRKILVDSVRPPKPKIGSKLGEQANSIEDMLRNPEKFREALAQAKLDLQKSTEPGAEQALIALEAFVNEKADPTANMVSKMVRTIVKELEITTTSLMKEQQSITAEIQKRAAEIFSPRFAPVIAEKIDAAVQKMVAEARKKAEARRLAQQAQAAKDLAAGVPNERTAQSLLGQLAIRHSDTLSWTTPTANAVRDLVSAQYKPETRLSDADFFAALTALRVRPGTARALALAVQTEIDARARRAQLAREQRAATPSKTPVPTPPKPDVGFRDLAQSILSAPLYQRLSEKWRKEQEMAHFLSKGLTQAEAQEAQDLFEKELIDLWAKARMDAARRTIGTSLPWQIKAKAARKEGASTLLKIQHAIRAELTNPDKNWEAELARENGWKGLTVAQHQRLQELDNIISNPETPIDKKTLALNELGILIRKTGVPPKVGHTVVDSFTASMFSGVPTLAINLFAPPVTLFRNLIIDGLTDPKNIPATVANFVRAMRATIPEFIWAMRNDAFAMSKAEHIQNVSTLGELMENGLKDLAAGKPLGLAKIVIGAQQYIFRLMGSLDQAARIADRQYKTAMYGSFALKEAGYTREAINDIVDGVFAIRQQVIDTATIDGATWSEANLRANEAVVTEFFQAISSRTSPEVAKLVKQASQRDADAMVGLRSDGISESDEGATISKLMNPLMELFTKGISSESTATRLLTRMTYGVLNVPYRTLRYNANFSPYGLVRSAVNKVRTGQGKETLWKQTYSNHLQARQRLREGIVGTALMALIALVASRTVDDDDEDEKKKLVRVFVVGGGPSQSDKMVRDAWEKNWTPYSIVTKVRGLPPVTIPLGRVGESVIWPIAFTGAMDDVAWKQKQNIGSAKPKDLQAGFELLGNYVGAMGQRGVFASFRKLGDMSGITAGAGPLEAAARSATYSARPLIPWSGAMGSISRMIQDPVDNQTMMGAVYANLPLVGPMLGTPQINGLGDAIKDGSLSGRLIREGMPVVLAVEGAHDRAYDLILKHGQGPNAPVRTTVEAKFGPLPADQWAQFNHLAGQKVKEMMNEEFDDLAQLNPYAFNQAMNKYSAIGASHAADVLGLEMWDGDQEAARQSAEAYYKILQQTPDVDPDRLLAREIENGNVPIAKGVPIPAWQQALDDLMQQGGIIP